MAIQIRREKVTPKKAQEWLEQNTSNRKLREGVAEKYAADMREGHWTECTQPIVFYDNGELADGQHRLWAIVESGLTIEFTIETGLPKPAGLNIDTGFNRTLVDNAKIAGQGEGLSNAMIAIAKALAVGDTGSRAGKPLSSAQKLELVEEHREAAQWAYSHIPHRRNIATTTVMAAIARAWYIEKDQERLDQFCKVVADGFSNGPEDSAAVTIRNYLLTNGAYASSTAMWRDTFLKVQNAISYFMKRQRLTVIRGVKEEAYPLKKRRGKATK